MRSGSRHDGRICGETAPPADKRLAIDVIKIDRSFLTETGQNQSGEAVLRCLIDLAHAIGIRVIVEGVETPEQLSLLQRLGGDEMRGLLLGRPAFGVLEVPA